MEIRPETKLCLRMTNAITGNRLGSNNRTVFVFLGDHDFVVRASSMEQPGELVVALKDQLTQSLVPLIAVHADFPRLVDVSHHNSDLAPESRTFSPES